MTYQQLLTNAQKKANELEKEDTAAVLLLIHVSNLQNHILLSKLNEEVPNDIKNTFDELFDEYLYNNKPVQYLIGSECFYGYDFEVNENVLIPRRETEELVNNVLLTYDEFFNGEKVNVVDIGTGSGAIAITLALEESNMNVYASDISKEAVMLAESNAKKLGAKVDFKVGDMLEPFYSNKIDILVSNPPYIPTTEAVESLVLENEPHLALFGGNDGLKFYRIILENAHKILNKRNIIAFEHAYDKNKEMYDLVKEFFPNSEVRQIKDMQNKDRMTIVVNKNDD